MELKNLIDDFVLTVSASGDVESPDTVSWVQRRLTLFSNFCHEQCITAPPVKKAQAGNRQCSYQTGQDGQNNINQEASFRF